MIRRWSVLAMGVLAACAAPQKSPAPPAPPPPPQAGPAVFRRLTLFEYRNTVRDLLGEATRPDTEVPVDINAGRSGYAMGGTVSWVGAGHLLEDAERLARRALERAPGLLPCNPIPAREIDQRRCIERFIATFGRRAFRRPLAPGEARALLDLYLEQRITVAQDFVGAARVVLTAMLMSPRLLYHWETPPGAPATAGPLVRLGPYEMASRLSYLLWASMPDAELFAAADADRLSDPAELERQVRRMLRDPRARDGISEFFVQWLDLTGVPELNKNKKRFRRFSPDLAESMLEETRLLATSVVLDGDGRLDTLLTSTASSVDESLARLYQVELPEDAERAAVALDPVQRGGILTRAAFLAVHATFDESHPIKRGVAIADRVLCFDPPPPPDNVPPPRPPAEGLSTRERFAEHSKNACARSCHELFDPLGLAFEHYDAVGGYRTEDGGKPVDASGEFMVDGVSRKFADAVELVQFLAHTRSAHDCMAQQWLRYALRRREVPADHDSLAALQETFARSGNIRELLVALTRSPSFTHRAAVR
jgi:hypothetical protein